MAVVLVLACLAVLAAVVALAMGRGGELSAARRDLPPPPPYDDRPFTGPAPFMLPRGLWGYQVEMTDQAMGHLRRALYERDARLAALERQVAELERRQREIPEDAHEGTLREIPEDAPEGTLREIPEDAREGTLREIPEDAREGTDPAPDLGVSPDHEPQDDLPEEFPDGLDDDPPEPSPWAPPGATRVDLAKNVDLVKNNAVAGDRSEGNEARS